MNPPSRNQPRRARTRKLQTHERTKTRSGTSLATLSLAVFVTVVLLMGSTAQASEPAEGTARVLCVGVTPTIWGTSGNDVLTGTPGDDVIAGLEGNDIIHGLGGDDIILGGYGWDTIYGGPGDDRICGGHGNDQLYGQNGVDTIHGQGGDDTLYGGDGDDALFGGQANDTIHGHDGADLLVGDTGHDTLFGGAGADILLGASGNDRLRGGDGNDELWGGNGEQDVHLQTEDGIDSFHQIEGFPATTASSDGGTPATTNVSAQSVGSSAIGVPAVTFAVNIAGKTVAIQKVYMGEHCTEANVGQFYYSLPCDESGAFEWLEHEGAPVEIDKLNPVEVSYCISNLLTCARVSDEKSHVEELMRRDGLSDRNGEDRNNSVKHAYWAYRLAKRIGPAAAFTVLENHEIVPSTLSYATSLHRNSVHMDLINNNVGVRLFYSQQNLTDAQAWEALKAAAQQGHLCHLSADKRQLIGECGF